MFVRKWDQKTKGGMAPVRALLCLWAEVVTIWECCKVEVTVVSFEVQ